MTLLETFKDFIGTILPQEEPDNEGDGIYSDGVDTLYPIENNNALKPILAEQPKRNNNIRVLPTARPGAYEVVVVEPKAFNDSITIVDSLKERKTVIVNLQLLDREQSQRIVDFLCGCTHALEGSQRKIGENVFIFTPSNINISQETMNSKLSSDAMWTKA